MGKFEVLGTLPDGFTTGDLIDLLNEMPRDTLITPFGESSCALVYDSEEGRAYLDSIDFVSDEFGLNDDFGVDIESTTDIKYTADMCSIGASEDTNANTQYIIYFNDPYDIADVESDLQSAITKLKGWINEAIADGTIESINLADCQVTSVSEIIDEAGNNEFDWDTEEVEYCADADDAYTQYI